MPFITEVTPLDAKRFEGFWNSSNFDIFKNRKLTVEEKALKIK